MKRHSKLIPVFPLSGALLLPMGNMPLNIFEPRYISMVDYALSHEKLIGMIQTKINSSNKLYKVGCVGKITSYSETEDKRYLINLRGLYRFQIENEYKHSKKFRLFNVEFDINHSDFSKFDNNSFNKTMFIEKLKSFFKKKGTAIDVASLEKIDDKLLIITIAMVCPFNNNEKQALLESKNINSLADTIVSLFNFSINQTSNYETIN